MKSLLALILAVIIIVLTIAFIIAVFDNDGHASGYGNTLKCTICKKTATHSTSNYGYCDEHWQDAINYRP